MALSVRGAFLDRLKSIDSEDAGGQKYLQMIQPLRLSVFRSDSHTVAYDRNSGLLAEQCGQNDESRLLRLSFCPHRSAMYSRNPPLHTPCLNYK